MKRKILTGFLITILLMSMVFADEAPPELCTDSDDGPDDGRHPSDDVLTTKGSTKYGIRTSKDICVIGKDTDVYAEESSFLKEYFCDNDKREYVIFDCRDYGFEKCVDGACIGTGTGSSGTTDQNQQTTRSSCGNKILEKDKGEECDPPGSVCMDTSTGDYGMCLEDCKCRWHSQVKADEEETEPEEEAEEDIQEETQPEEEQEDEEETEDKIEVPDIGERKDFTEEPGIKVTTGIAGFFKKIWNWFKGLFS